MVHYLLATEEQKKMVAEVKEICDRELSFEKVKEYAKKNNGKGEYPWAAHKALAEAGYYSMSLPKEWGGRDLDFVTRGLIMEEISAHDLGFAFSFRGLGEKFGAILNSHIPEEDKKKWIDRQMTEHIGGCYCLTEPSAGSDAKGIQTTVVTHPDNYAEDAKTLSDRYTGLVEKTGGKLIDLSSDFATDLSVYAKDIISKTAAVKVDEDYVPVTSITLGEDVSVATDGTYKFPVTVTPDNATVKDIIWKVEDESIATINTDLTTSDLCVINPVKEGETKLIAKTTDGGYTAYFTLTVKDIVADGESAVTCKPDMVAGIISDEAVTKVTLKCDKETPTVDADVLKTIFEALAKAPTKDITFSFEDELGDEVYSWNFASKELKDATTAIKSFAIDPEAKVDVVTAAVEATKTDGKTETIHFAHDGELPGTATVTTETKLPDGTAYLYYFNPETKKLELVSDAVKVADGKATYKIEHCCDYVLSLKKLDTEPKDDTKDEPKDEPAPSTPQTTPTAPAAPAQTTPKAEVTPKAQTTPKTQTKPKAQTEPKKKTSPAMGDNTNSVLVVTMLGLGVVICTVGIKRRKRA